MPCVAPEERIGIYYRGGRKSVKLRLTFTKRHPEKSRGSSVETPASIFCYNPRRGGDASKTAGKAMTENEDLLALYMEHSCPVYRIYEPPEIRIILGAGRKNRGDVIREAAERDHIPVLLRRGGGGTVVLSAGMVVLALVTEVDSPFRNREYALLINGWQREALQELGVKNLQDRGISDLAIGEKKILGASVFRRKRVLFYQSSLLVSNDLRLFSRYLSYPSHVPEYRRGRSHGEFCTNLRIQGSSATVDDVVRQLASIVSSRLHAL